MGILVGFAAGFFIGARTGKKEFDDLARALRALRQSDEFGEVVMAARSHLGHTLRELALMLDGGEATEDEGQELVARVRTLFGTD